MKIITIDIPLLFSQGAHRVQGTYDGFQYIGLHKHSDTMKHASATPTAILLIDIQEGFRHPTHWGLERSTPSFESNVTKLLHSARAYNEDQEGQPISIIHIHHHSQGPNSMLHPSTVLPGTHTLATAPMAYAAPLPSEPILTKSVNSSFIGTDLEARIRALSIKQLIILGLTTDHCVSTTTRMAANLHVLGEETGPDGEGIVLLSDATATFSKGGFDAEMVHAVNLASLDGEFASVCETNKVIREVIQRE